MHSTKFPKKIIKRSEADVSRRASTKLKEIKKMHHHLFSTLAAGHYQVKIGDGSINMCTSAKL